MKPLVKKTKEEKAMKKFPVILGAFLVVLFAVGTANAAFLNGKQIFAEYLLPDQSTQLISYGQLTVGPFKEIYNDGLGGYFRVNLSDKNITFKFLQTNEFDPAAFNGLHFQDTLNNITNFASVTVNPATTIAGFASRVSFDGNNIYANFQNLEFNPSTVVSLDIAPVPIPSAMILFASGLAGLVGIGRMRMKK